MSTKQIDRVDHQIITPTVSPYHNRVAHSNNGIKTISIVDINDALIEADTLQRRRMPINIHKNFDEVPQRFVNCLNAGTYIRPHKHDLPNHWELKCWISGELKVLVFDEEGRVKDKILMDETNTRIVEIPASCYHTVVAIKKGSYLEIRNGKYQPPADKVFASWAPEENSALAKSYQERFLTAEIGDLLTI